MRKHPLPPKRGEGLSVPDRHPGPLRRHFSGGGSRAQGPTAIDIARERKQLPREQGLPSGEIDPISSNRNVVIDQRRALNKPLRHITENPDRPFKVSSAATLRAVNLGWPERSTLEGPELTSAAVRGLLGPTRPGRAAADGTCSCEVPERTAQVCIFSAY